MKRHGLNSIKGQFSADLQRKGRLESDRSNYQEIRQGSSIPLQFDFELNVAIEGLDRSYHMVLTTSQHNCKATKSKRTTTTYLGVY